MKQKLLKLLPAMLVALTLTSCDSTTTQEEANATAKNPTTQTDTTPPVITLNGEASITLEQNAVYTEQGATALDAVDGNVTVSIGGSVDTSVAGIYVIIYTAMDKNGNEISVSRKVNVFKNIQNLFLSIAQSSLVKKNGEPFVKEHVKVVGKYSDGHKEEVTDFVKWHTNNKNIRVDDEYLKAKEGNFTIYASLNGVVSNKLNIGVKHERKIRKYLKVKIVNNDKRLYPRRNAMLYLSLVQKPTSDVTLKIKLNREDNVSFDGNKGFEATVTFKPTLWDDVIIREIPMGVVDLDRNNSHNFTIITKPFVSQDIYYDDVNPEDIVIDKEQNIELIEPSLKSRRGAIRGVTIGFRVLSKELGMRYELINPPKGMKILGQSDLGEGEIDKIDGVNIEWNVPMKIEEKIYTITMQAIDVEGNKAKISFPIKVPKTKPIQTELINNEWIVTDKTSHLYGMKMKGYNGKDISNLKLRSVEYRDIWKKNSKWEREGKNVIYNSFIVYDKAPKVIFELPKKNTPFYKYSKRGQSRFWRNINRGYLEDSNGTFTTPVFNEYDNGGNIVYLYYFLK
jgi:hypothetical protein